MKDKQDTCKHPENNVDSHHRVTGGFFGAGPGVPQLNLQGFVPHG